MLLFVFLPQYFLEVFAGDQMTVYCIFSIFISSNIFAKPFESTLSLLVIMVETINIMFHNFSILF